MTKRTPKHAETAAKAHTDLNIFYGVIALMEGGLLSADSYGDAERIIRLCKAAGAKCLARYDRAIASSQRT